MVVVVISGIGEYMVIMMVFQRCVERIYNGIWRGFNGLDVKDDDEDVILELFVVNDFMGYLGVKNCYLVGVIGVMVVKKIKMGYYFYFVYNMDFFVLVLMGGGEIQVICVMFCMFKGCKIVKGGCKI